MKLAETFRFEFTYQARRAWPWLMFAALAVFGFLMARDASLSEALYDDFFVNSPFAILKTTVAGSVIWVLIAAAIAGDTAARDVSTGMYPLTYTSSVGRGAYLGGRFLAALALNALILLAVPFGILVALYVVGMPASVMGPFRPAAYLTAYAFIALPNAVAATALQFMLSTRSGRATSGYLGSLLLLFMSFFIGGILLWGKGIGALVDPIGVRFILDDLSRLWTPTEKSWRLLSLDGTVLTNRLVWLGVGSLALALTWLRFRFVHRTETVRWWRRRRARRKAAALSSPLAAGIGVIAGAAVAVPQAPRRFGMALAARQTRAFAGAAFRAIATSWAGIAVLTVIPLLAVPVIADQMMASGVPQLPATPLVLRELTAPLSSELSRWVIIPLLIVFFAGELVWRERDAGLGEITDAVPGSEWAPFLGKFLGLSLFLALLMGLLCAAGMLSQLLMGYHDFEVGLYLKVMFGLQLPEYLLFALLSLAIHVVVDQKYVGHLVAILAFVFLALSAMFGIRHDLLVFGAGPGWSYTTMRGFGASLGPWLWFKLYWAAWALLFAVVARLLWVRGRESGLGVRLRLARRRLVRSTAWAAAVAAALIVGLGGFIFYNTNVRNPYLTAADVAGRRAVYERRYGRYDGIPQPELAATKLRVEIHPRRGEVEASGSYRLVNHTSEAIDSIHLAIEPGVATRSLSFDRPATLKVDDPDHGYRIYALAQPLQPGDSLRMDFAMRVQRHGFRETGADESVVSNGTYFLAGDWLPAIGYQRGREIISAAERRAHGLRAKRLIPSLYDAKARDERSPRVAFEAIVGTDGDQVAVAPGALRRAWTENGRRYFQYATSAPIGTEWAFASAHYAVREARWNHVAIRIYHDPASTGNLDRITKSIQASLDYYSREFGPYPYDHITVVERPGDGIGLHADASFLSYAEGFSLWRPKDGDAGLDLPFAVVAHETAHQWTVPYAGVEGAPVMSESVAWYYAMKLVQHARGDDQLRRLLAFMRQPYPYAPIRRGEPLLRGLDPYLSYRRGPFALWAMSEYVGEAQVNGALRRMLEAHRPEGTPAATTLDLYRELQAVTPGSLRYLLHDLFEVNTWWQLGTEQATAVEMPGGTWQVTLKVRAKKMVYDSAGVESEVPMNDLVPIGVFGPAEQGGGALSAPLHLQMHRLRSGEQTITITVPKKPVLAGVDPNHLLDWETKDTDDNAIEVKVESPPGAAHKSQ